MKTTYKWGPEEKKYLSEICKGRSYKEIIELMSQKFSYEFSKGQIEGTMQRNKLTTGAESRFKKGHKPWNTGMKGLSFEGSKATQFKKGRVPENKKSVGSERILKDKATMVKQDTGKWELKHRVFYKEYHGEIPQDYVIIFADGNKNNFSKENLVAITRNELKVMNANKFLKENKDLTLTGLNVAKLIIKISNSEKKLAADNQIE